MKNGIKKRAKIILPEIKKLISQRAINEPNKSREKLADELIEEIINRYPKELPPSWETVIKKVSAARNHEQNPLDNLWHMGTLEDYPITSESLPYIAGVQDWREKTPDDFGQTRKPLTIREAQWVARLYPFVNNPLFIIGKKKVKIRNPAAYLSQWAEAYAEYQIICELSDTSFDTIQLDRDLREGKIPFVSKFKGEKYQSVIMVSQDNKLSRITVEDGEK